jgi:hypothetical protein
MYPVRVIKLVTGEVIIAGIADTTTGKELKEGVYTFEDPMIIIQVPTKQRDGMVMETMVFMKPWMEFSNDLMFIVPKDKVVCISIPDQGILMDYEDAKKNMMISDIEMKTGEKKPKPPKNGGDSDTPKRFRKDPPDGDQNDFDDEDDDDQPENFNEGEADDIGPF